MKGKLFLFSILFLFIYSEISSVSRYVPDVVYPVVKTAEENDLQIFMDKLGFKESSDNYQAINRFGYIGRYQFGTAALKDLGIIHKDRFLNNNDKQDRAVIALCKINKYRLRDFIDNYRGKVINGITITESGLLAAAHLVGARSVKIYLKSEGKIIRSDGNNTSLEHYLELFQGYDLGIEAEKYASL